MYSIFFSFFWFFNDKKKSKRNLEKRKPPVDAKFKDDSENIVHEYVSFKYKKLLAFEGASPEPLKNFNKISYKFIKMQTISI